LYECVKSSRQFKTITCIETKSQRDPSLGLVSFHSFSQPNEFQHLLPLKEFHAAFHKYCKRVYSSEFLFEDCCNIKFTKHICKESEHDNNYGQIHEEEFAEKQDLLQTYQKYLCEEDFEVNQEEVSYNSKNEEILANPPNFQVDQRQDDETSVDLDLHKGQWLIEDHTQLDFEEDDFGNDTDNVNYTTFIIMPNVSSDYCHDQTIVLNSYFDQAVSIQSSLLDHHGTKISESQGS
jgi:hypothetical protein